MTSAERTKLRRKAFWRVADFARYMGLSNQSARRVLKRYDTELHGMLLRRSRGKNRLYGFYWAALASHDAAAFVDDPLDTLQRVDELEDAVSGMTIAHRSLMFQVGQNIKDIDTLKRGRRTAA